MILVEAKDPVVVSIEYKSKSDHIYGSKIFIKNYYNGV